MDLQSIDSVSLQGELNQARRFSVGSDCKFCYLI